MIDGSKLRFEEFLPQYSGETPFNRSKRICVFDGQEPKIYFPEGLGDRRNPMGEILSQRDWEWMMRRTYGILPLTMTFRGLDPALFPKSVEDMTPGLDTRAIDDAPCQEFILPVKFQNPMSYWFHPDQDYVVRRVRDPQPKSRVEELNIRYKKDDKWGWLPESWTSMISDSNGTVLKKTTVQVVSLQLNGPADPGDFSLQFPVGCIVTDLKKNNTFKVQADGSLSEYPPRPPPPSMIQIGLIWGERWFHQYQWLLVSFLALVGILVVIGVALWRWTRPARK